MLLFMIPEVWCSTLRLRSQLIEHSDSYFIIIFVYITLRSIYLHVVYIITSIAIPCYNLRGHSNVIIPLQQLHFKLREDAFSIMVTLTIIVNYTYSSLNMVISFSWKLPSIPANLYYKYLQYVSKCFPHQITTKK
jgi:hypothetical protein